MILGAEIGLFVYGLYALIQGRLNLWTGRDLEGTPARVLGAVAMAPIVLAFVIGLVLGAVTRGDPARMASLSASFPWIELGILVACVTAIYGIGWPLSGRPAPRRVLGNQLPGRPASVPGRPGAPRPSGTTSYPAPNRMGPVGRPARHDRAPLTRVVVGAGAALVVAGLAYGLYRSFGTGAQGVFRRVAPSVVVVLGGRGEDGGQGSGVVVAPGRVITNAHVARHTPLRVLYKGKETPAKAAFVDPSRDLAELRVDGLSAPAAILRTESLSVGDRVYAVGAPRGLDLTLSEGLVSSLRTLEGEQAPIIQTSAPISPGSSGGGLFDEEGRLIGITTFQLVDSQNLNFALPVAWIDDLRAGTPIHSPLPYNVDKGGPPKEEKIDVPARVAELLGEPWSQDREAAIEELGKLGRRGVTPLTEKLERGDDETRARAAFALGQLASAPGYSGESHTALSRLRQSLTQEKQLTVRIYVAKAIEKFGRDGYQALAFLQRHEDSMLRAAAASALGHLGDPNSVRSLGFMLEDKDTSVRDSARKALVEVGGPAVETLAEILKRASTPYYQGKTDAAVLAAQALGAIGPAARGALPQLEAASRSPDGLLASAASLALEKIRG